MKKHEYLRQRIREIEISIEERERRNDLSRALLYHMTQLLQELEGQLDLPIKE